jgi:hypothetical protein
MGKMTHHEFLINIMGSLVLNIVPFPTAPIAPSGALKNDFSYEIRLPQFGETVQELMKKRGAKVPDLLLVNKERSLLVAVECKSEFTFEIEEKLSKQIAFYSSSDFKAIWKGLFTDLSGLEIWLFCPKDLGGKIANFLSNRNKAQNPTNVVLWVVELGKEREQAHITKSYGTHLDGKLNEQLENKGLVCSLPRTALLVDPTLPYGERVYRIGIRILGFMASVYLTEKERIVTIQDFRERHPDAIMTDSELKRCLRYLMTLIPEIGEYNNATGELVIAKRPSLDKIKTKLEKMQEMTEEEIKVALARIGKERRGLVSAKRPKPQKTKLDKWLHATKAGSRGALWRIRLPIEEKHDFTFQDTAKRLEMINFGFAELI